MYFDENGTGTLAFLQIPIAYTESGFAQVDPNTGVDALTYLLPGNVNEGIVGVLNAGVASEAISFYNQGSYGYMAYYTGGSGLSESISRGYVPTSPSNVNATGDTFVFYSGTFGNSDAYHGTFNPVPEPSYGLMFGLGGLMVLGAHLRGLFVRAT
jgi:hypothetical protein